MATTTVSGSTGSYVWEMTSNPNFSFKTFALQFNNYKQTPTSSQPFVAGTTNILFPLSFQVTPSITANTTGLNVTVTQNYVTIPTPPYQTVPVDVTVNGLLVIEGF